MQYSIATAITTILFASTFTSAAALPRQANDVTVQFKTGDGDASVQQSFVPGKLQTQTDIPSAITSAVNGLIVGGDFQCQFFSDAKGTTKIGGVLSSKATEPVAFTDKSSGEVDSKGEDAVTLGSVCCATTAQFQKACGKLGSGSSSSSSGAVNNAGGSSSTAIPARIQINGLSEEATQGEILADGKPHTLSAPLDGTNAISASVVGAQKAVHCQAADASGNKLGGVFSLTQQADLTHNGAAVTIQTVTCNVA